MGAPTTKKKVPVLDKVIKSAEMKGYTFQMEIMVRANANAIEDGRVFNYFHGSLVW